MESIENKMLKDFASPPHIWLRYIDDTFVVLKKTEVVSFHKFINNIEVLNLQSNKKLIMLFRF